MSGIDAMGVAAMTDARLAALTRWAGAALGDAGCTLRPASGDASFRRYFRVHTGADTSYIAMDAPPEREDCRPYVRIARALRGLGLNAPEVIAQDLEQGFLLLTDFGDRLYLQALEESTVERLYGDALDALLRLQQGTRRLDWLPPYDAALLRRELELFPDWYLARHLGLALDARRRDLEPAFACLIASALEQPRVAVHRDYHSRNLLVTPVDNPGILDFQDAVLGPVTYDLVSLLRDCYIAWPRERVEAWALRYRDAAARAGVDIGSDARTFLRWFDLMSVQRHLKASGIFARLKYRDGKSGYLEDVPRTLGYVREVVGRYPELAGLAAVLEDARAAGAP